MMIYALYIMMTLFATTTRINAFEKLHITERKLGHKKASPDVLTDGDLSFNDGGPPPCKKCKWFVPNANDKEEHGFCKQFNSFFYSKDETLVMSEFASHCRKNENMCGQKGYLFEPLDPWKLFDKSFHFLKELKQLEDLLDLAELEEKKKELEDQMCGEVNEKPDLEKWEEEYKNLQRKINLLHLLTFKKL